MHGGRDRPASLSSTRGRGRPILRCGKRDGRAPYCVEAGGTDILSGTVVSILFPASDEIKKVEKDFAF